MRKLLPVVALLASLSPAIAQEKKVDPTRIGRVLGTSPVTVTVAAKKIGITGVFDRGASCLLRPGDQLSFVAEVASTNPAQVVVQKRYDSGIHFGKPNFQVCGRASNVFMLKSDFEAWEAAYKSHKATVPAKKAKGEKI